MLELMIVVALLALLSYMGITAFGRFRANSLLDQAKGDIVSALSTARSQTLSSVGGTVYGVHFEATKIVLFQGSTYASSSTSNIVTNFDPRVRANSVHINGGSEVIFQRLTGATSNTGTVAVQAIGQIGRWATTTINSSGIID